MDTGGTAKNLIVTDDTTRCHPPYIKLNRHKNKGGESSLQEPVRPEQSVNHPSRVHRIFPVPFLRFNLSGSISFVRLSVSLCACACAGVRVRVRVESP